MNLQHLRYAVEIARTGSITQAAKNLYMGQPNLSKSIKELESEIGITLFHRTARGVAPTPAGEDFLGYARSILAQMDSLEAMYRHPEPDIGSRLSVSVPRASYIADAFSRYAGGLTGPLQLQYKETNAVAALNDAAAGEAQLSIVRCQSEHLGYFNGLIHSHGLCRDTLWEFDMVLLMHESHPLAALREIPYHLLRRYTELVHGDLTPVLPPEEPAPCDPSESSARIAVFDRAGQFDLLRGVPGSYMWVSPVPFSVAARQELVQKPCRSAGHYCDIAVYRPGLSSVAHGFLDAVRDEIRLLEPLCK